MGAFFREPALLPFSSWSALPHSCPVSHSPSFLCTLLSQVPLQFLKVKLFSVNPHAVSAQYFSFLSHQGFLLSLWAPARKEANTAAPGTCHACADRAQVGLKAGGQTGRWPEGRQPEGRQPVLPVRAACLPEVLWPLWSGGGISAASSSSPGHRTCPSGQNQPQQGRCKRCGKVDSSQRERSI